MPGNNRGGKYRGPRHRFRTGYDQKKGPYIGYTYKKGSHVPGHYIDKYGDDIYVNGAFQYRSGGFADLEMKFHDTQTDSDAFATTWAAMQDGTNDSISSVAQGDTESTRDGRIYHIHSVHLKWTCNIAAIESSAAPLGMVKGRVCLVWDTQTNGAVTLATLVMDGGQTDDTLAFRNLQYTKRFRVLMDKPFFIQRISQTNEGAINLFAEGSETTRIFTYNRSFKKPIRVTMTGTGGTVASVGDNNLQVIGVANSTGVTLNMQTRIRYTG